MSYQDPAIQNVMVQLSALDSRMRIVAQRMRVIENNEQIIGKTLITHNKKLKEIEAGTGVVTSSASSEDLTALKAVDDQINKSQSEMSSMFDSLRREVIENKEQLDKIRQEIMEMKYILENINPMAYVTVDQVSDLIDEKLNEKKS
jgi:hypothetical protein